MSDKQKRVKCIVCGEPGVVLCPARVGEVLDHRVMPYRAIEERWQCRRKVIRRRLGKPDLWMPQGSRTGTVGMVETDADGAFTVDLLPTVDRDFRYLLELTAPGSRYPSVVLLEDMPDAPATIEQLLPVGSRCG